MGNTNNTQWSSIVFKNEEDEENWFEWIEEPERENHSQFLPVSPNMQVSAVQPLRRACCGGKSSKSRKSSGYCYSNNNTIKEMSERDGQYEKEDDGETIDDHSITNNVDPSTTTDIIQDAHPKQFPTGEVNISLSYDPVPGGPSRIKVQIVKARNLSCKAKEGKDRCGVSCSESYVQVTLLCCHTIIKSECTATKRSHSNVLYYETWAFDIPRINLGDLVLEITAVHRRKHVLTRDHVIGRAVTAESAADRAFRRHWWEALAHPGKTINRWQTLWN